MASLNRGMQDVMTKQLQSYDLVTSRESDVARKPISTERGIKRKKGERFDLKKCIICERTANPTGNKIVYCDGCERPFHQQCHVPFISDIHVEIGSMMWFCSRCKGKKNIRKPSKVLLGTQGHKLTFKQKVAYLETLSHEHLIQLVLFSDDTNSDTPLFPPLDPYEDATKAEEAQNKYFRLQFGRYVKLLENAAAASAAAAVTPATTLSSENPLDRQLYANANQKIRRIKLKVRNGSNC